MIDHTEYISDRRHGSAVNAYQGRRIQVKLIPEDTMPLFRKKPVVIEARQFTGQNAESLVAWINDTLDNGDLAITNRAAVIKLGIDIPTLEGNHLAAPGDWIIKGVAGEFYPCRNDIFARTYEPAA